MSALGHQGEHFVATHSPVAVVVHVCACFKEGKDVFVCVCLCACMRTLAAHALNPVPLRPSIG